MPVFDVQKWTGSAWLTWTNQPPNTFTTNTYRNTIYQFNYAISIRKRFTFIPMHVCWTCYINEKRYPNATKISGSSCPYPFTDNRGDLCSSVQPIIKQQQIGYHLLPYHKFKAGKVPFIYLQSFTCFGFGKLQIIDFIFSMQLCNVKILCGPRANLVV